MSEYNLCEHNQSAYKPNHCAETALICVQNDILRAMDNQNIVIMLFLDISAAFYTGDHNNYDVTQTVTWCWSDPNCTRLVLVVFEWQCQSVHINGRSAHHLIAVLRVRSLKILYSVRDCYLFLYLCSKCHRKPQTTCLPDICRQPPSLLYGCDLNNIHKSRKRDWIVVIFVVLAAS